MDLRLVGVVMVLLLLCFGLFCGGSGRGGGGSRFKRPPGRYEWVNSLQNFEQMGFAQQEAPLFTGLLIAGCCGVGFESRLRMMFNGCIIAVNEVNGWKRRCMRKRCWRLSLV